MTQVSFETSFEPCPVDSNWFSKLLLLLDLLLKMLPRNISGKFRVNIEISTRKLHRLYKDYYSYCCLSSFNQALILIRSLSLHNVASSVHSFIDLIYKWFFGKNSFFCLWASFCDFIIPAAKVLSSNVGLPKQAFFFY